MVASTATKGYPATTVADLISLAGVSRATFYEHFDDKEECFRAAVTALLNAGLDLIRQRLEGPGNPKERGERALRSFLELTASQPAAARMSLVDAYAAGAAGLEPINEAFEAACQLTHDAMRMLPGRDRTPEELSRAVIGGLHRVIYLHLYRGEAEALLDHCGVLWRWASGYQPPDGLPSRRRRLGAIEAAPALAGRDQHERILRGFANAVSLRGFSKLTVSQIATQAGISNATFYQHFESKEDALLAALDLSGAQLIAATLPAARRADEWPAALQRAVQGLCDFLVSEPAFARLRAVEVYAAGPEAISHRDRALEAILEELIPAEVREGAEPGAIALDASSGAVYSMIYERVRRGEFERLVELAPLLGYLMLSPFVGAEEAMRVAGGNGRARAARSGERRRRSPSSSEGSSTQRDRLR
jgi:AcrR family transcriptional regulator